MHPPDDLTQARVAIIGLGLIGGSLALALRGQCAALSGVDVDPGVVAQALALGVVERGSTQPRDVLAEADVILPAAPVRGILRLLEELPTWQADSAVVMDVGSTKAEIAAAMQALPERFEPLGGHPMCGKEHGSLANAESGLFQGAVFALTPLPRTTDRARRLAVQIVQAVGARPLWIDAETHDRWVAHTSHMPYLLANALAACTPEDVQALIGPGLRSTTRLAATPLSIMMDILATNRENVLDALRVVQSQLDELTGCLESGDWRRLEAALEQGRGRYEQLICLPTRHLPPPPE